MGFCRRCGDIVTGTRCKCGGTAVAPVVSWSRSSSVEQPQDRWSKTYVSRDRSPTRSNTITTQIVGSNSISSDSSPTKRFPRPISGSNSTSLPALNHRVSAHIASTTSQFIRPPSPLKQSITLPAPESDILPSLTPHTSSLAKVYGSVLQPKETLETNSCAICSAVFTPDATIYPDPTTSSSNSRFLCRGCFIDNGGSKGTCPACSRPVLILKAEGGFVQTADQYWHKKCFNCEGCFKNIGEKPMVDLLGRPSCTDCFDGCLNRGPRTPKKNMDADTSLDRDNLGGLMRSSTAGKGKETSPAIEELEQRLGILKSRENSPTVDELGYTLSAANKRLQSPIRTPINQRNFAQGEAGSPNGSPHMSKSMDSQESKSSPCHAAQQVKSPDSIRSHNSPMRSNREHASSPSPLRRSRNQSPVPTEEAIEEMKRRFLRGASPPTQKMLSEGESTSPSRIPQLRSSYSSPSLPKMPIFAPSPISLGSHTLTHDTESSIPLTPDLVSDFSDTTTQSSGPDSPPRLNPQDDLFNAGKLFGQGYGARDISGNFLEKRGRARKGIDEDLAAGTPTPTPKKPMDAPRRNEYSPIKIPPASSPTSPFHADKLSHTTGRTQPTANTTCARCGGLLFALKGSCRFVTVPAEDGNEQSPAKTYHAACFTCAVCSGTFKDTGKAQAIFVRTEEGPTHPECASPVRANIKHGPSPRTTKTSITPASAKPAASSSYSVYSSSRYEQPPQTAPATTTTFPRFGSSAACPGCHTAVSPMERGVVPGPQGTRWHAMCLVCGGKRVSDKPWVKTRSGERNRGEPGCGKRLDSAAKSDGQGGIWCRECLLMLPASMRASPQSSPTRSPIVSHTTGTTLGRVVPQVTGTTTLARQFTGLGGDAALLRQLTGGGLSPTRQLAGSPTKQLGMVNSSIRPRPKSVIGMRSAKSVDEGRGMFLVRQMTGGTGQ